MDRIKCLSYEVLDTHKHKFGEDFADNKKVLDQITIIRSKGLKNEVAGYITKFIKKEIREEKFKQAQDATSQPEEQLDQEIETETLDVDVSENNLESPVSEESTSEPNADVSSVEEPSQTTEKPSE